MQYTVEGLYVTIIPGYYGALSLLTIQCPIMGCGTTTEGYGRWIRLSEGVSEETGGNIKLMDTFQPIAVFFQSTLHFGDVYKKCQHHFSRVNTITTPRTHPKL